MRRILGRGSGLLEGWWRSDLYSVCVCVREREREPSQELRGVGVCAVGAVLLGFGRSLFVYMMDGCMIHCRYVD